MMKTLSRRTLIKSVALAAATLAQGQMLMACKRRVVEVERLVQVERQVTKIVKEVVRETVEAEPQTTIVRQRVEKLVTPEPTPRPKGEIVADVTSYGWTQYARLVTPAFEDLFPDISIHWRTLSDWNAYPGKVAALQAANQLGDIVESPLGPLIDQWVERGTIRALDDLVATHALDLGDVYATILGGCRRDGALYGIPFLGSPGEALLIYDVDQLAVQDVSPPGPEWSLRELDLATRRLARHRDNGSLAPFPFGVQPRLPSGLALLRMFGGHLLDRGGRTCLAGSDEGIAALSWVHDAIHEYGVAPNATQIEGGVVSMFLNGRISMLRDSIRRYVNLQRYDTKGRTLSATLFPSLAAGGPRATVAHGVCYAVTSASQAAESAIRWISYMASRETGVQMLLGGYAEPGCRYGAWTDARTVAEWPICSQLAEIFVAAEPIRYPWNRRYTECDYAWNSAVGELLAGRLSPTACASQICEETEAILERPIV